MSLCFGFVSKKNRNGRSWFSFRLYYSFFSKKETQNNAGFPHFLYVLMLRFWFKYWFDIIFFCLCYNKDSWDQSENGLWRLWEESEACCFQNERFINFSLSLSLSLALSHLSNFKFRSFFCLLVLFSTFRVKHSSRRELIFSRKHFYASMEICPKGQNYPY